MRILAHSAQRYETLSCYDACRLPLITCITTTSATTTIIIQQIETDDAKNRPSRDDDDDVTAADTDVQHRPRLYNVAQRHSRARRRVHHGATPLEGQDRCLQHLLVLQWEHVVHQDVLRQGQLQGQADADARPSVRAVRGLLLHARQRRSVLRMRHHDGVCSCSMPRASS